MSHAVLGSHNRYTVIALMGAVAIIPLLPVTLYLPVLPDIAEGLHCSLEQFQLTLPLFVLTQVFFMPVIALLSDLGYRLQSLYWGLLLFITGSLVCWLSTSIYPFCFGRILQAISAATLMTVIPALVNESYDNNRVAQMLSYITAIGFFIPMAGPELSLNMANLWGWQSLFIAFIVYGILLFIICRFLLGKPRRMVRKTLSKEWQETLQHWHLMLTDRYTLTFLISNTGVAIVCQIYVSNSDFLYLNYYQLENVAYSYILSTLYLSRMTITIVNGLILKHWHYQQVVRWSIPLLTLLTGFTFLLDWYGDAWVGFNLVMPIALFALSGFVVTNAMAGVLQNNSAWAMQATALLFVVFSAIASVINGLLMIFHDGTPKMLSLFSLLILLTTWILYLVIRPGTKP